MSLFSQIISAIAALSLVASPTAALSQAQNTQNSATSTMSASSGGGAGTAVAVGVGVGAALLVGSQMLSGVIPKLTSFGGRVVTVIPCNLGGVPMLHITILPSGIFPVAYIWTPATITKLYGPPIKPGQQLVGLADVPFTCFIGVAGIFSSPIPLYGLRMTTVGTSLPTPDIVVPGTSPFY